MELDSPHRVMFLESWSNIWGSWAWRRKVRILAPAYLPSQLSLAIPRTEEELLYKNSLLRWINFNPV